MYYSHFGLNKPPFRITPNAEFFYSGGNRGPILDALIYAISQGEGIIKVTGEVGSGKTMLCTMLQSRLPPNIETVYIVNPSVSPDEILQAIAVELQLSLPPGAGHLQTMQLLHQYLLDRHAQHKRVVMFVEEAQSMPIATLEEVRLLSNLETADSKLLQIVLFGQPEFEANLRQPQIRQLRERITHSFRLAPLKPQEVRDYLDFRMRAADYRGPELFSPAVVRAIAKASGGLTRRINLIADKTLLATFSDNTHGVKLKHVKAAVRDSEFSSSGERGRAWRIAPALLLLAIGTAVGVAVYPFVAQRSETQTRALPPALPTPPAVAPLPAKPPEASRPVAPAEVLAPVVAAPGAQESRATVPESAEPKADKRVETSPVAAKGVETSPVPTKGVETSPVGTKGVEAPVATAPQKPATPAPTSQPSSEKAPTLVYANPSARTDAGYSLESRVAATRAWLAAADSETHSIQLLGTADEEQLKHHLKQIAKYVEMNDIFVYRTLAQMRPSLTVLYGSFGDRHAAQEALANLPAQLKAFKPHIRTVKGIRAEIAGRERT